MRDALVPLIILVALRWTLSSSSSSFLKWGAQHWTQYSRWGLARAEQSGRRTSLVLLATLLLMHPRIPLAFLATRAHCWLMDNLSSTSTSRCKAALQQVCPEPVLVHGVVPPQVQDPAFAFVEHHQVPLCPVCLLWSSAVRSIMFTVILWSHSEWDHSLHCSN